MKGSSLLKQIDSTYYNSKGEYVGRFVEFLLEMCFWATPVFITGQNPFDAPAFREVCSIFEVDDFDLFNNCLLTNLTAVDQDVIRFDV